MQANIHTHAHTPDEARRSRQRRASGSSRLSPGRRREPGASGSALSRCSPAILRQKRVGATRNGPKESTPLPTTMAAWSAEEAGARGTRCKRISPEQVLEQLPRFAPCGPPRTRDSRGAAKTCAASQLCASHRMCPSLRPRRRCVASEAPEGRRLRRGRASDRPLPRPCRPGRPWVDRTRVACLRARLPPALLRPVGSQRDKSVRGRQGRQSPVQVAVERGVWLPCRRRRHSLRGRAGLQPPDWRQKVTAGRVLSSREEPCAPAPCQLGVEAPARFRAVATEFRRPQPWPTERLQAKPTARGPFV